MAGQNPTTLYKRYASPAKTYMEKGKKNGSMPKTLKVIFIMVLRRKPSEGKDKF